jgi:hypothetical protein
MARFPLFFVSASLVVVAMIGVAVSPLRSAPLEAVEARVDQGTFILDGQALSQIRPARGFHVTPAPGPRNDQSGPRLANDSALTPDAQNSKGARLMLGPQTIEALKGKPFSVIITARGVANSPAQKTGFGLVTGAPIGWGQIDISPTFGPLRFDIPASDQVTTGLAFWPAIEGQGHGIEIQSIALQPILTSQGMP